MRGEFDLDTKKFYSLCLQGNVLDAINYLRDHRGNDKESIIQELEKRYEERFLSENEIYPINSDDLWVNDVLNCYIAYFRSVLTNHSIEEAENRLAICLSQFVDKNQNIDEIESELESIFRDKGYSFLGGVTPPFRGPYIWKNTVKREFNVVIPDSEQKINVFFISRFLLLSWAHFATFGKHYAGGWAKPEGLYYVDNEDDPVDINSDWFQVSFLKHEAQHYNDFQKFPKLNERNLEYRAKLTELIYLPPSYKLIEKFINEAKDDKAFPHSYAAYYIIKQLSNLIFGQEYLNDKHVWETVTHETINDLALALLQANNNRLYEEGIETKGVI